MIRRLALGLILIMIMTGREGSADEGARTNDASMIYFGTVEHGKLRFASDVAYPEGTPFWVYLGSNRKVLMRVEKAGPIDDTCGCDMVRHYMAGADGKFHPESANRALSRYVFLDGSVQALNKTVLVSRQSLELGTVSEEKNEDFKTKPQVLEKLRKKLVETARRRLQPNDPVATRDGYFPFRAIDRKIVERGPSFLKEVIGEKVFQSARGRLAEIIATWTDQGRVVGTLKMTLMANGSDIIYSKIDDSLFLRMAMPEFRDWNWKESGYRFSETVFDLGNNGTLELIEPGYGYEATWISLIMADFDKLEIMALQAQGCGC